MAIVDPANTPYETWLVDGQVRTALLVGIEDHDLLEEYVAALPGTPLGTLARLELKRRAHLGRD